MKKNVCVWLPAQLESWKEKGIDRIRISYWQTDPNSGVRRRFRPTFGLNRKRVISSGQQQVLAKEYIKKINAVLPLGYPFIVDINGQKLGAIWEKGRGANTVGQLDHPLYHTPIIEALEVAKKVKCSSNRYQTRKTYQSAVGQLCRFLKKHELEHLKVSEFSRHYAIQYMDEAGESKLTNNSYNNVLLFAKSIFTCLVDREYLPENPFKKIKGKRKMAKKRTRFCPQDRDFVAGYFRSHHPWFYYGVLLQYYCLLRPVEICRLQFKHFDLVNGLIKMPCEITKNWKEGFPTIPNSILHYFTSKKFTQYAGSWFLFSDRLLPGVPNLNATMRRKKMNDFHRKILEQLDEEEQLKDRTGLTVSS